MKKFVTYLTVIIALVAIGFGTYYLVQNNESFVLDETYKYVQVGDEFELNAYWLNKRAGSSYTVYFTDPSVITESANGKFVAIKGGISAIVFRTTNSNYLNVSCTVFVGDGSSSSPFYISTPQQLLSIGDGEENNPYQADKYYQLISDIDFKDTTVTTDEIVPTVITPIAFNSEEGFTGSFNGNGYTIKNAIIDPLSYPNYSASMVYDAGLFYCIGVDGYVNNVILDNITITAFRAGNVGIITGTNYGTVERISIINSAISITTSAFNVGGAVGMNVTTDQGSSADNDYVRKIARVDRVGANVVLGAPVYVEPLTEEDEPTYLQTGIAGNVGGLVGYNYAGVVIYSYARGEAHLNNNTETYGGLVGINEYASFADTGNNRYTTYRGAHIKDCYSSVELYTALISYNPEVLIGGIIGSNLDSVATDLEPDTYVNRIIGNYYNYETLTIFELDIENLPITKPYTCGIGQNTKNNVVVDNADVSYIVLAKTTSELKSMGTYLSHVEISYTVVVDVLTNKETIVSWDFITLWSIGSSTNDGYPTFSMAVISLQDGIYSVSDGITISNRSQLQNMSLSGNYILIADIDITAEDSENTWTPIGTVNNPFTGSLQAADYITAQGERGRFGIYNLTATGSGSDNVYGGLFGVVTGESGGVIKNLLFVEPVITGYQNAGVIAGINGYSKLNLLGEPVVEAGMTIQNITIEGATVTGTRYTGGVVGCNYGTIQGVVITDVLNDNDTVIAESTITLTPDISGTCVGGIAGYNLGTILRSQLTGTSSVAITTSGETVISASAGGIVGYNAVTDKNTGLVQESGIFAKGVTAGLNIIGSVGGIVGYNTSKIVKCAVVAMLVGDTENPAVYVGGIAGQVTMQGSIDNCLVQNSTLEGSVVGGVVGKLDYFKADTTLNYTFDANNNISTDNDISIQQSGAKDVVILGATAGGFAGIIKNGICTDVYAIANISGVDQNSIKAGLVGEIQFVKQDTEIYAGVICRAYNVTVFGDNGKAYAVSKSEFLKNPFIKNIPFVNLELTRPAGFITNYIFNNSTDGNAAQPESGNWLSDVYQWFMNETNLQDVSYSIGTTESMQLSETYRKLSFSNSVWNYSANNYPTSGSTNYLISSITNYSVYYTRSDDFSLVCDYNELVFPSYYNFVLMNYFVVPNGTTLEFEIIPAEGIEFATVTVKANNVTLTADEQGKYVIKDIYSIQVITITYTVQA